MVALTKQGKCLFDVVVVWSTSRFGRNMDEFETVYQQKLLPILKGHGLVESAQPSRTTVDSVFSRLFGSPSEVIPMWESLDQDSAWVASLEVPISTYYRLDVDSISRTTPRPPEAERS